MSVLNRQRELEFEARQLRADKELLQMQRPGPSDQATPAAAPSAEAEAAAAAAGGRAERLQAQLRAAEAEAAALRRQLHDQASCQPAACIAWHVALHTYCIRHVLQSIELHAQLVHPVIAACSVFCSTI